MNRNDPWMQKYEKLKKYQKEFGNIDVPCFYEKDQVKLGLWLNNQRQAYKGNTTRKITEEQIQLLNKLGIKWQINEKKWDDYYQLLKEYQQLYGNIEVPYYYEKNQMKLGKWLNRQRYYKNKGMNSITQKQISLLNELGIKWQINEKTWEDYYNELKEYKEKHGNTNISTYDKNYKKEERKLGIWLQHQKQAYAGHGTLKITQNQIQLLNQLEIDWNIPNTRFLKKEITEQNKERYNQILLERINHVMDDLMNENKNEIDSTNQKEIEKIMIKRIWR